MTPRITETPTPGGAYSMGYQDGMHFGARCAQERYFWCGLAAGVVLAAVIVLAAIYFTGGTK